MTRRARPMRPSTESPAKAWPNSKRGHVVRFAVVFTLLVILGSISELYLQRFQIRTQRGEGYQHLIATVIGDSLRVFNVPATCSDTTIHVNTASVEVAVECTGIKATAIFCAGVLAFPCSWRNRAIGLLTGILGVFVLNVARISALALVAGYRSAWFDDVHAVLMQGFLILFVAPLWIAWMLFANRRARASPPTEPRPRKRSPE